MKKFNSGLQTGFWTSITAFSNLLEVSDCGAEPDLQLEIIDLHSSGESNSKSKDDDFLNFKSSKYLTKDTYTIV
jgi:hypothetical protein